MSKLNEIFELTPVEVVHPDDTTTTVVPDGSEDEDHLYARARHYELAEKGSEALDLAMKIARETENPRAVEVLSGLIKTLSDVNKSLLTLNKDKADVKTARIGKGGSQQAITAGTHVAQQNIIFTGSSKDLNKIINEQLATRDK